MVFVLQRFRELKLSDWENLRVLKHSNLAIILAWQRKLKKKTNQKSYFQLDTNCLVVLLVVGSMHPYSKYSNVPILITITNPSSKYTNTIPQNIYVHENILSKNHGKNNLFFVLQS